MSNVYIYIASIVKSIESLRMNFGSRRATPVRVNIVKKRLLINFVTRIGEFHVGQLRVGKVTDGLRTVYYAIPSVRWWKKKRKEHRRKISTLIKRRISIERRNSATSYTQALFHQARPLNIATSPTSNYVSPLGIQIREGKGTGNYIPTDDNKFTLDPSYDPSPSFLPFSSRVHKLQP